MKTISKPTKNKNKTAMKRMNAFLLAIVAISLLTFSGCTEKDKEVTPGGGTPDFVGKRLILSAFTMEPAVDLDGDGKPDPDLLRFLEDCEKDNIIIFEKGGKLSGENGLLRCDGDGPSQGDAGTWTYDETSKILRIVAADDKTDISEWKVLEASSKVLKVQVEVTEDGFTLKAIMTWKAV
jgi:hypothetical protein